ncbi:urease accessory protein UreD [Chelatococcus reniformis]|uniref:Urease accessory protein UreD n=1 Tax=Chelatococcus reniformis TaxID=1494448 RepID=A0A916U7N4_9HYPH|nr:urease accessory protein UreD [Chelatococcus reniformis]GGC61564.1 urease accessory protein UreD [Chelatococcus reniformis]
MEDARPQLDLVFARRLDRTILERRIFRWPFVLTRTFALERTPPCLLSVFLQTSSGAVHGEDDLRQRLHIRGGAAAYVTTQGASPVHRATPGQTSKESVGIRIEDDGHLEYVPEPRILFPGAALDQTIEVDCAPGGFALAADVFTIHDPAGEGRRFRSLRATTILRRGGDAPLLVDRVDIRGLGRGRTAAFAAFGSVYVLAPDGAAALMADVAAMLPGIPGLYGATSELPGDGTGFSVRLAGYDLRSVRTAVALTWSLSRQSRFGCKPSARGKDDAWSTKSDEDQLGGGSAVDDALARGGADARASS